MKTVNLGTPSKGELKEEFERYFRENDDLGPLAKQVGSVLTSLSSKSYVGASVCTGKALHQIICYELIYILKS